MHHSKRILRTALTGTVLSACLILNASALTYGVGTVTGDSLRLRAGADTNSTILATATQGTQVAVLENQTSGWYKVSWKGTVGYMSADYLSVSLKADADLGSATLNTDGAPLNLRSGPGTSYDKVTTIPANATLTITGMDNGWYKTTYNGVTGYVLSDYVTLSGSSVTAASATSTGVLNTDGAPLNLRSGPGTSYDKVATIPANATLTITGSENGWYKTSYNGVTGYVLSDYVTLGGTAASSTSSSIGAQIVAYAKQFLGCSYVYGASGPSSFDCSGFTSYVFKHFGYTLNRSAASQYNNGTVIDKSQLQPGDLLLWRAYGSSSTATHAGIYIGNNQYIHASSTAGKVIINDMDYANSTRYLVGIRRIAN
jgi:cell wall-associated NlpC family hydrolase